MLRFQECWKALIASTLFGDWNCISAVFEAMVEALLKGS